jgi:transposase
MSEGGCVITIEFSEEDKAALNDERYNHPHPFVQRKMEALWLKSQRLPCKHICQLTNVCSSALTGYLRDDQQGGLEALKELSFYRPASDLDLHRVTLEACFPEHPPSSAQHAMDMIETLTGVKRSLERVRAFMKRAGMKCRKAGMIPAKADIDAHENFKKQNSIPALKRQKQDGGLSFSLMPRISF